MQYLTDFRVMICGSRSFNDFLLLEEQVIKVLKTRHIVRSTHNIIIICGDAKGADTLGEQFAQKYGLQVEHYPALWNDLTKEPCKVKYNKYGKPYNYLAGFNRNKDMVLASDLIVMFHDGVSRGTVDDLELCKKYQKDYEYIRVNTSGTDTVQV